MLYFFDTSGLQHVYLNTSESRGIRRTVSDVRNSCFIAEATILEIASTLGRYCRKNGLTTTDFRKLDAKFWKHVETGKLQVRRAGHREFQKARHLFEYSVEINRKVTTFDALIAASALECALQHGTKVCLCVEDRRLHNLLKDLPAYRGALAFRFISRPLPAAHASVSTTVIPRAVD